MSAQQFLQPVINDLKTAFHQAKVPTNYSLIAEQRYDNPAKYQLTLVVGRDNELFEEGAPGMKAVKEVSTKHSAHLGLGFCESIGICGAASGRGIFYVKW